MVVRVDVLVVALLVPQDLQGPVGDHLIGVHVGAGARTALDHVHGEVLVQGTVGDLLAGLLDGAGHPVVQQAQRVVRPGCGPLHLGERDDELREVGRRNVGDAEVLHSPQGLHAVVGAGGNVTVTQQIVLGADRCGSGTGAGHRKGFSSRSVWVGGTADRRPA